MAARVWHGHCECLGMPKRTSHPTDETVFAAVEQFAQQALADGCNPAELCCTLSALAVRIGLDLDPSTGIAFAVVMSAVSDAAAERGASQTSHDANLDIVTTSCGSAMRFTRKSDRDRRSNNVAVERQRSSASSDVSALRAAFRRCHSDSEFRARFIGNCRIP
jgi:hypothetical protein